MVAKRTPIDLPVFSKTSNQYNPYGNQARPNDNPGAQQFSRPPDGGDCASGSGTPSGGQTPGDQQAPAGKQTAENVKESPGGRRRLPLSDGLRSNISNGLKTDPGLEWRSTSGGQVPLSAGGKIGVNRVGTTINHDNGWASDGVFYDRVNNRTLNPLSNAADRTRLCPVLNSLGQNGINQFGFGPGYQNGKFHLGTDNSGRFRHWGKNGSGANSQQWVRNCVGGGSPGGGGAPGGGAPGGGDPNAAGNSAGNNCNNQGRSGCKPISSAAPAAANSMAKGAGMGPAGGMMSAIQSIAGAGGAGGIGGLQSLVSQGLQGALGNAGGLLQNAASVLSQGGFPGGGLSALSGITSGGFDKIAGIGSSILPSITGVIPQALAGIGGASGGLGKGFLTDLISGQANKIIQSGIPNFGGFSNILSSAIGASGVGSELAQGMAGAVPQVFSNAIGNLNNIKTVLEQFDGTEDNPGDDEGIEGEDTILEVMQENLDNSVNFVGPLEEKLKEAIEKPIINGFSSLFLDYQSFVTQGLGNLTDNIVDLGNDLFALGDLGDMTDLLNIGTPNQVARQMVEKGLGIQTGLIKKLEENDLTVLSLNEYDNRDKIRNILDSISDSESIRVFKETFRISETLQLDNIGEILNPNKIFPRSYKYNRFENLNDIALTLALCSDDGVGILKTFRDLGSLLSSLETVEFSTELLEESTPVRVGEAVEFANSTPFESMFNTEGPVVADFIGTAAGYVHGETLPAIAEILEDINDSSYFDNYKELMQLLADTLNSVYWDGSSLSMTIPNTAGYTFGTYSNLDAATSDIVDAVETELQSIVDTLPTADEELWSKIQLLETLHTNSASYLLHEKSMRRAYGIEIGEPRVMENFYGDGSTVIFPLKPENDDASNFEIFIDGLFRKKEKLHYNYDADSHSIIFNNAPGAGELVEIAYDVPRIKPESNKIDAWALASDLENLALQTGFGNPSDYLRRITTDDVDGQRIQAIMIQARNREKFNDVGIGCPGFNRVLNEVDDGKFIFVEKTGIWSDNPGRAAEIWIEQKTDMTSDMYYGISLSRNSTLIKSDIDVLCQNYMRQMLYITADNQIAMTQKFAEMYTQNSEYYGLEYPIGLELTLVDQYAVDGFVIGPYKEIISEILRIEDITDDIFFIDLSQTTRNYLSRIELDMGALVGVAQRTMLYNISRIYGLDEQDMRETFGMPGVGKYLLKNIAERY